MTEFFIEAAPRDTKGKNAARKLRQTGSTPGVVYGLKEPTPIFVNTRTLGKMVQDLHGSERMVSLRMVDANGNSIEEKNVLIKEVQAKAVGNRLLHVDFQEIDLSKKVQVTVEVRGVGDPVGLKFGGILQTVRHEIMVECLPIAIPEYIDTDVSHLEVGHSLHVKDVPLPSGIAILTDPEETLFVVSLPRTAEAEEEEEAAEAAAAAEANVPAGKPKEDEEESE